MKGLYGKYKVEKTDSSQIDPNADYFVLRLDTDPHARVATIEYAKSIMLENPQLASDLLCRVSVYIEE